MSQNPNASWAEQLIQNRTEKDRFFAEHPQSPIPPEAREEFESLSYFEPDEQYRIEADVTAYDEPEPVEMETTDGRTVRYLRVATFSFELRGEECELHAYRQEDPEHEGLFVPFRDKTTGQQTYSMGRYMEFEPEEELSEADTVTLDFNMAYSPFCAYSETFSCPLPPEENWLPVAVPAGEKAPETAE